MRHIKKFESFDLGRFSEEETNPVYGEEIEDVEECEPCGTDSGYEEEEESEEDELEFDEESEEEHQMRRKVWGDESTVERVASFRSFVKESKKAKPDFLDLDKDGDKKESMKKAAKDAKDDKKDNKKEDKKDNKKEDKKEDKKDNTKGLSAAQKKLPPALQKSILKKQK